MSLEALWDSDFCLPVADFNALFYSSTYFDQKTVFLSGHLLTNDKKAIKIRTIIKPLKDERLKALLNSKERLALEVKTIQKKTRETRYNSIGVTAGKQQWEYLQKNKCCHLIV